MGFVKGALQAFVTDREDGLAIACSETFPSSIGILCMMHIEHNLRNQIKEKLKLSEKFCQTVLSDV